MFKLTEVATNVMLSTFLLLIIAVSAVTTIALTPIGGQLTMPEFVSDETNPAKWQINNVGEGSQWEIMNLGENHYVITTTVKAGSNGKVTLPAVQLTNNNAQSKDIEITYLNNNPGLNLKTIIVTDPVGNRYNLLLNTRKLSVAGNSKETYQFDFELGQPVNFEFGLSFNVYLPL